MKKLKQEIQKYVEERGWKNFQTPGNIAKSISIESAELLEIFQWQEFSVKEIQKNEKLFTSIKEELADVLIYATEMAISLDLDIEKIMREKLKKAALKYPADKVKGKDGEYMKIKMHHRAGR